MSSRVRRGRPFPFSEILPDRVRKQRPAAMIAVEAEKTARAAAIGAATGLFRTPAVLAVDPERETIDTERIADLVSLREVLLQERDADALLVGVGRALAAIHEGLALPEPMRVPLPKPFAAPELGVDVVLHGDFNTLNLFVCRSTGELVITDWEVSFQAHRRTDPAAHEVPAIGPRYFDLGWFVTSLFLRTWFGLGRIRAAAARADRFLSSYFSAAGPEARPEGFASYLDSLADWRRALEASAGPRALGLRRPRSPVPGYASIRSFAASLAARRGGRCS